MAPQPSLKLIQETGAVDLGHHGSTVERNAAYSSPKLIGLLGRKIAFVISPFSGGRSRASITARATPRGRFFVVSQRSLISRMIFVPVPPTPMMIFGMKSP